MTLEELAWVKEQFERTWPWLAAALARQPYKTHEKHHVWEALERGDVQLWPTENSATVTELRTYPTGLKAIGAWLGGGDLKEIERTAQAIEKYGRSIGCDVFTISGREGWLRALPGFKRAGATIVKDLNE